MTLVSHSKCFPTKRGMGSVSVLTWKLRDSHILFLMDTLFIVGFCRFYSQSIEYPRFCVVVVDRQDMYAPKTIQHIGS